ncbi:DUF5812 family protein [Halococcoides cellulosivorans]|uniref:Uncharacterized protein n=1 Tax=Halococcoides cellulosivorans TaxID=1679096 RepID=A0A2R4WYK3_9EURY|nr:DUF5812 family protein [Halococcoides cellulosivorans]AWB26604.1 hypothetical protein HARCEL1_02195 [Halococcoides cellulosivorans]
MTAGRFVVTHVDDATAQLRDVQSGQVHPVVDPPDLAAGDALAATLSPADGIEATWSIDRIERRWTVAVAASDRPPSERAQAAADALSVGEIARLDVDDGELHVICVPESDTDAAVGDVTGDDATRDRAIRLGVERVAVRHAPGVIAVRYGGPA